MYSIVAISPTPLSTGFSEILFSNYLRMRQSIDQKIYNLHFDDIRDDFIRSRHGTTRICSRLSPVHRAMYLGNILYIVCVIVCPRNITESNTDDSFSMVVSN